MSSLAKSSRLAPLALAALVVAGCAGPQAKAISAFQAGKYSEAITYFQRACPSPRCDPAHDPRYMLYRGLTHFTLGDTEAARWWLARAKHLLDTDNTAYNHTDQGSLLAAWESLGYEPGTLGATVIARQ